MKEISKIMYKKYALNRLKYDFMGYKFEREKELSFHHLIIGRQECRNNGIGNGYWEWNGALLVQRRSHQYLHTIGLFDEDRYLAITSEIFDEIVKGHLDMENIRAIDDILTSFEREYCGIKNCKGRDIIREEYVRRLVKND